MIVAASLFSGAGGTCCGLVQAGATVIWGNEWSAWPQTVWQLNHPKAQLDSRDIREIPVGDFPKELDLLAISPPCPEYSKANPKRRGGTAKEDTTIAEAIVRVLDRPSPPRWVGTGQSLCAASGH
jgi:DNA (cytosine-5)-methyltransferase 1